MAAGGGGPASARQRGGHLVVLSNEHAAGEVYVRELRWVHSLLRRDLQAVRALAGEVRDGAAAEQVSDSVASLAAGNAVWSLRRNCLHYCHFVHAHHALEDAEMFPALRRADPALAPALDKL